MKKSLSWIKKRTDSIWSGCEGFLERYNAGGISDPVYDLMYSVSMGDSIHCAKELLRSKEKNPELIAEHITDNLKEAFIMSFGLGFVIGGTVELTDPEAKKAIEELREELKKFRIFPYLPRERESGSRRLVAQKMGEKDPSNSFLISEDQTDEALLLNPEGQYILEIDSETKNEIKPLTREEARRWLKEHDPEASFKEKETEAQGWLKEKSLQKEKTA